MVGRRGDQPCAQQRGPRALPLAGCGGPALVVPTASELSRAVRTPVYASTRARPLDLRWSRRAQRVPQLVACPSASARQTGRLDDWSHGCTPSGGAPERLGGPPRWCLVDRTRSGRSPPRLSSAPRVVRSSISMGAVCQGSPRNSPAGPFATLCESPGWGLFSRPAVASCTLGCGRCRV